MKIKLITICGLLGFLCTSFFTVFAQDMVMQRIAQNDGTDFKYLNDITQDADVVMWCASISGLVEYD